MATTALDSMLPGTVAPIMELSDVVTGKKMILTEMVKDFPKGILVIFLCRHCPYVKHIHQEMKRLAVTFMPQGIGFLGISANDPADYPEDAPAGLREMALEQGFPFPIVFDETQEVAKAFTASCTPDFFLFDHELRLAYHGRLDASSPKNGIPLTGEDLCAALEKVVHEERVPEPFFPSLGCSIKWKEGAQ